MGDAKVITFGSDDALAAAVADAWLSEVSAAQQRGHKHLVALSGGRITKKFFGQVVEQSVATQIKLDTAEFFWADERCLPPDDPESNFRLADELLFTPLAISSASIHRIHGEISPEAGARQAGEELARVAGVKPPTIPVLDLVLLGMGEDGHVASLFPENMGKDQDESSIFMPVNNSPKPPPRRVSLSYAAIAAAREVWVLVSGAGKQAALQQSLLRDGRTPLAEVIRSRGLTRIYSDIHLP